MSGGICPGCGGDLEGSDRFCPACGAELPVAAGGPSRRTVGAAVAGAVALAAVVAAVVLASGGSDGGGDSTPVAAETVAPPVEPDVAVDPATETEPVAASFEASRSYHWEVASSSGSSARIDVELGDLVPVDSADVPEEFARLTTVCEVDDQRDAFLPLRLTATNTTVDFDAEISTGVLLRDIGGDSSLSAQLAIGSATSYTEGPSCEEPVVVGGRAKVAGVDFGELVSDEQAFHDWLVVVKDYYSPEWPEGNEEELARLAATIEVSSLATSEDVIPDTTCFSAAPDTFYRANLMPLNLSSWGAFPLADIVPDTDPATDEDPPECA